MKLYLLGMVCAIVAASYAGVWLGDIIRNAFECML